MAGVAPDKDGAGSWYRDIGGGMGQALNAASAMGAYTLSDRGTWLSFANKGSLVIAIENDSRLITRYDVIELDPRKRTQNLERRRFWPTGWGRPMDKRRSETVRSTASAFSTRPPQRQGRSPKERAVKHFLIKYRFKDGSPEGSI